MMRFFVMAVGMNSSAESESESSLLAPSCDVSDLFLSLLDDLLRCSGKSDIFRRAGSLLKLGAILTHSAYWSRIAWILLAVAGLSESAEECTNSGFDVLTVGGDSAVPFFLWYGLLFGVDGATLTKR